MSAATRLASIASLVLLLKGCQAKQSVLAPHGPMASEIAILAWVMVGMAGAVLAIVLMCIVVAFRGSGSARMMLSRPLAVVMGGIAFPVATLTVLLVYGLALTGSTSRVAGKAALRIEVTGEQWWWRVAYVDANGRTTPSANEIRMPVGAEVEFVLRSADVIHSFWIPSLGGKIDMIPGRTNRIRLTADRPGVYRGQCAEYCGGPHAWMGLSVVALPPSDFARWFANEASSSHEPASEIERRGRAHFLAFGCGGCHAIRGTEAGGSIGPDLTHLGTRRSVGVDTLPLTQENVERFIVNGQHVKPGNLMPPFRIFSDDELRSLSTYLVGLK